ncbi:nucleic acid/nucleotide deaminase domain-containing protein [Streptomyces sp. NPDC057900]|uniref:WXG100-like domain-containing protein n=1 Tax=Streptomyces sp. NPDC057900 TaxID=3346274 RepID=UPI0036E2D11E
MGKRIPDDLVEVLDLVGVQWPNIDEDEVRETAKDYRHLAEGLRDVITQGNNACSHIVSGRSKGATVTAIDRRWGKLTTKDLVTFINALDSLGDALDDCAGLIEGCKIVCIAELSTTAAAATAGVIGMFFTAGLSGLLSAAAIAACRIALHEAIDYAVGQITSVVTDKIEAKILTKIEDLFTERLDAHDDADLARYADGGADLAQDLVIEFDEFDKSIGGYDETKRKFDEKKNSHKAGGSKRRSSVKKDSRFRKLATVMDKAEDAIEKKADETVHVLEEHGGKISDSKKGHEKNDQKTKKDIEGCQVDDTPMFLLNADGTVEKLNPDGTTVAVKKDDNSGILDLMTEPGKNGEAGRVWRPRKGEKGPSYPVSPKKDQAKVTSTKIPSGSTDLSQATQIARYHNSDWGGGNYAAGRYVDSSGKQMILVTNSEGPHSERTLGYPILKAGKQDNLKALYTEREPCQGAPSWCDKWTAKYFKPDLEVTHTAKYLNSDIPKIRDAEHEAYRSQLQKDQKAHGVSGGFK